MKHYIIYIHGVNTRGQRYSPEYANKLIKRISHLLPPQLRDNTVHIPLYWGDVNEGAEQSLLNKMSESKIWSQLALKELRSKQALQFVGDAALYVSATNGGLVIDALAAQAREGVADGADHFSMIHLVTHSWGTIILFDVLFAPRWDDEQQPSFANVKSLRSMLLGLEPLSTKGLILGSVHTMGSPIALFSLIHSKLGNRNDISPKLAKMLVKQQAITGAGTISWKNYVHPGDLISWPIEKVLNPMLGSSTTLRVRDVIVKDAGPPQFLLRLDPAAVWSCGESHNSYWNSKLVAREIVRAISTAETRFAPLHTALETRKILKTLDGES